MIGFYGGTFDPIHEGHIHLAKEIVKRYSFESFFFCPNYQNPLKKTLATPPEVRLEMIQASLKEIAPSPFSVLDWEINSSQSCYTIDTLRRLKKTYPNQELALILGSEVFATLEEWREPKELLSLANVIVVTRNEPPHSVSFSEILERIGLKTIHCVENRRWLHSGDSRWVNLENVNALPYSSTQLRREIEKLWSQEHNPAPPQGIQRLVWQVIKEKRLYAVT